MTNIKPYFQNDWLTLYNGKAEEVLPQLEQGSVDLVFTSPPYNLGNCKGEWVQNRGHFVEPGGLRRNDCWSSTHKKRLGHYNEDAPFGSRGGNGKWKRPALADGYGEYKDNMPHEDYVAWQHDVLLKCWNLLSSKGAIYYNHKPRIAGGEELWPTVYIPSFEVNGATQKLPLRQTIIWNRSGGVNFTQVAYVPFYEVILLLAKPDFRLKDKSSSGAGSVWTVAPENNNPHPAPFPLELPTRALSTNCLKTIRTVADPFAGSGTTLKAARDAGCQAIGIEPSRVYCDMILERLSVVPCKSGLFAEVTT